MNPIDLLLLIKAKRNNGPNLNVQATKVFDAFGPIDTVITPDEGYDAMESVECKVDVKLERHLVATQNGTYPPNTDDGYVGWDEFEVNVQPNLQSKSISITQNGTTTVSPDQNKDGLSSVEVEVNVPSATLGEKSITQNGTYNASDDSLDGYSKVIVNVASAGDYTADDWLDKSKPVGAISSNATAPAPVTARTNITSITLPEATSLPANFAANCTSLTTLYVPKVTTLNITNIVTYTAIEALAFPKAAGAPIYGACISYNSALKRLDFGGNNQKYNNGALQGNPMLTVLIMRCPTVAQLGNVNVFNSTPFRSGGTGGTIYIPKSLYDHLGDGTADDYKAATNWSTLDGYGTITWKSIESTHTDPDAPIDLTVYYADGTLIPTE